MLEIWTSRYQNRSLVERPELLKLGVTRGLPKMALRYRFMHTPQLAPPYWLFSVNDRVVFEPKFRAHLQRSLGVAGALTMLRRATQEAERRAVVLLCYEDVRQPEEWCHRLVVSDWLAAGIRHLEVGSVRVRGELPDPSSPRPLRGAARMEAGR
jgi:hypothetical protein